MGEDVTARLATWEDLPAILEMSRDFWAHSGIPEPFDADQCSAMVGLCITEELAAVATAGSSVVGFIAAVAGPMLCSPVLACTELAWYVKPEARGGRAGIDLLNWLSGAAKAKGVKYLHMLYMETSMPNQVRSIYEKSGFERCETTYRRAI